jgi:ABC-type oligopeptide transport system substrate-binding subunit
MAGSSRSALFPPAGDRRKARKIAPDRGGTAILYTCNFPFCRVQAQIIRSDLAAIGLDVEVREFPTDELFVRVGTKGEPFDIVTGHWGADYADPSDFLNVLLDQHIRPEGNLNASYYTAPSLARKLARVARVVGEARGRAYAALADDVARTDAPWVAYATGTARDFFSTRMGCQLFQPVYGIDLGALCLRRERS